MEKSANYFIVGLFITCAVFTLVGFLIWMQGPHTKDDFTFYTVEFTDSIGSLAEGSDVQYKGVKVGKVMKAYLVKDDDNLVRVDIGVNKDTPVRAHTKITLEPQGITGLVRMEMSTQNDDLEMPVKMADTRYPVLHGQGSLLSQALDDLPVITSQAAEITKKVNGILTRNRGHIDRFASEGLSQFTAASHEIKDTSASFRKLSEKLNENPSQILFPSSSGGGVEIPP